MDLLAKNESLAESDAVAACDRLGRDEIQPFEPLFPAWSTVERAIREAGRDRRISDARSRSLGAGRRPGESEMDQWKREYDPSGPDEEMRRRIDALNAKLAMSGGSGEQGRARS